MPLTPEILPSTPSRLDTLIKGRHRIERYADLPQPHQLALANYLAFEQRGWAPELVIDGIRDKRGLSAALVQALPALVERYGERLFGMARLPASEVKRAVMGDVDVDLDVWPNWAAYHAWYCLPASGPVPDYPKQGRWPVILSNHPAETLQDGWHRLHCYARQGARVIPAVFFPEARHLA